MKRTSTSLAKQYETALRGHGKQGSRKGLSLARAVGKRAASVGLGTLDLARLHEQALAKLGATASLEEVPHPADAFFAEVLAQMEQTSPSAGRAAVRVQKLSEQLRQRTTDLANSRRLQKQGWADRNALKAALKQKTAHYARLLAETRDLEGCLQSLARRMLSAQESERTMISRALHEDVAQAMVGIQVRLAHLMKEAARNTTGLEKELTVTQRLVEKSAKTLERFAGKLR